MTAARTSARASTAGALLCLTAAVVCACYTHLYGTTAGLAGAGLLWLTARSYQAQDRAVRRACQIARRGAVVIPDPAPMPDWETRAHFDQIIRNSYEETR